MKDQEIYSRDPLFIRLVQQWWHHLPWPTELDVLCQSASIEKLLCGQLTPDTHLAKQLLPTMLTGVNSFQSVKWKEKVMSTTDFNNLGPIDLTNDAKHGIVLTRNKTVNTRSISPLSENEMMWLKRFMFKSCSSDIFFKRNKNGTCVSVNV